MTAYDEARRLAAHLERGRVARQREWRELARWLAPHRGGFEGEDMAPDGTRRNAGAFTLASTRALERGAAGMTSGMTPRGISWFEPDFQEAELWEASGAPAWLDAVDRRMKDALADGGFYQAIHCFNTDLLWAGCALLYCETGRAAPLRFECAQVGTYAVALDGEGRLDAVCRSRLWTPARLAALFGAGALSERSRAALEREPYAPVRVIHLVRRRNTGSGGNRSGGASGASGANGAGGSGNGKATVHRGASVLPWESLFWEDGGEDFLHTGGYAEMPYFFTVWHEGVTPYGTGPGDGALPDARQLDLMERHKLEGLAKLVRPPVQTPAGLRATVDLSPGAVNAVEAATLVSPILDLAPYARAFQFLQEELRTVAGRLEDAFMASVFASMPLDQRPSDMSATEFLQRRREALQQLGPVMSAYEPHVLTPLLHRAAAMLDRAGLLPPPPESLAPERTGGPLLMKMTFTSPLANALRQTGADATRALLQDVMGMAQVDARVLDKLDLDQAVDELATGLGAPGRVIRADADVLALRRERAEAQAAQQREQEALNAVQAAQGLASAARDMNSLGMDGMNGDGMSGDGAAHADAGAAGGL